METHRLIPHSAHPALAVEGITARVASIDKGWLELRWRIEGAQGLVVPPLAGKARADGLWQTTCFELFIRAWEAKGYTELNLSPSERWAAYDFSACREGMSARPISRDPVCTIRRGRGSLAIFDAALPLASLPPLPWRIGLSAVIEETGGTKSYWALAHPPGKPDFHHPDCFAASLAAPERP